PTNRERARHRAQPSRLAVPIAIARRRPRRPTARSVLGPTRRPPLPPRAAAATGTPCPAKASRVSKVGLDSAPLPVLSSFHGRCLLPRRFRAGGSFGCEPKATPPSLRLHTH